MSNATPSNHAEGWHCSVFTFIYVLMSIRISIMRMMEGERL